ncbi:MAG: tetratricopeptide repeat protein [Candidatus Marinimicrobia bacterium]|nr:tetratricopeptide repeat protein [Candidatus Neomarinimicrobiota bacterium]
MGWIYNKENFFLPILTWLFIVKLLGQSNDQFFVGTRPMGMGETFVAIADDGNTIYWNPAGLPGLRRMEFTVSYANLFGLGLKSSYAGYVYPIRDEWAIGVDWAHLGYDDSELGYSWNHINLGMGFILFRSLALGFNGNLFSHVLSYDGTTYGKGTGFGLDLGLLWTPRSTLRFGLTGYNVTGAEITYETGEKEELGPTHIRGGVAWKPFDGMILAADFDDRWHLGGEYWIIGGFALRGGLQKSWNTKGKETEPLIYSIGAGFRYKVVSIDYAYEIHPWLFPTHRISLSLQFRPALVSIKSASIKPNPVFRSLHRHYESGDFAEVTLKNSSERELPVEVSLFIPTTMDVPHEERIVLPPKSKNQYNLGVTFSNKILTNLDAAFDHLVQPEIKVTYFQENQEKFVVKKLPSTYIMGKGKISWDIPERIASFVTPEDKLIDRLTRDIIQHYRKVLDELLNRSNLGKGIILFDALGAMGLTYSPDMQTPFIQISKNRSAFDSVKYPSELLKSRVGDCDDLTVLYGSMLENIGIATMFLDVFAPGEGHIFLMFDSGLNEEEAMEFSINETEYVVHNGRIWIPVETTLIGETFFTAWNQGALEYHRRKKENMLKEIDIRAAQSIFPPSRVLESEMELDYTLEEHTLLKRDLEQYSERLKQLVLMYVGDIKSTEDYYLAGTVYLEFGRLTESRNMFQKALEKQPGFADAQNGMGVSYIMDRKYDEALFYLTQAAVNDSSHGGYLLNIAITNFLQGKTVLAENVYRKVIDIDLRFAGNLDYLFTVNQDTTLKEIKVKLSMADISQPITISLLEDKDYLLPSTSIQSGYRKTRSTGIEKSTKSYRDIQAKSNNNVGYIFAQRNNFIMAVEFFQKAHQENPTNFDYLANLSLANYALGNYDEALVHYQTIIKGSPELKPRYRFIESEGKEKPDIFQLFIR